MKKILLITSLLSLNIFAEQITEQVEIQIVDKCETEVVEATILTKPTKEKNIEELMSMVFNREFVISLTNGFVDQIRNLPQFKDQKKLSNLDSLIDRMIEKILSKEVIKEYAEIYSKHFDNEDIEAMLNFYKSKVGQKVLKNLPEVSNECSQVAMKIVQDVILEILPQVDNTPAAIEK